MHLIDRNRDAQTACGLDRYAWARTPGCRECSTDSDHLVDCDDCRRIAGLPREVQTGFAWAPRPRRPFRLRPSAMEHIP